MLWPSYRHTNHKFQHYISSSIHFHLLWESKCLKTSSQMHPWLPLPSWTWSMSHTHNIKLGKLYSLKNSFFQCILLLQMNTGWFKKRTALRIMHINQVFWYKEAEWPPVSQTALLVPWKSISLFTYCWNIKNITYHFFSFKNVCILPTIYIYIYMQCMTLRLKSNYFPKEKELVDVCNAHVVFYLWDRNNNLKHQADEFHVLSGQYLLLSHFRPSTHKPSYLMSLQVLQAADHT